MTKSPSIKQITLKYPEQLVWEALRVFEHEPILKSYLETDNPHAIARMKELQKKLKKDYAKKLKHVSGAITLHSEHNVQLEEQINRDKKRLSEQSKIIRDALKVRRNGGELVKFKRDKIRKSPKSNHTYRTESLGKSITEQIDKEKLITDRERFFIDWELSQVLGIEI